MGFGTGSTPDDYESQFRSCVLHNVYMTKAFVPAMIESGWGARDWHQHRMCNAELCESEVLTRRESAEWTGVLRVLAKEVGTHGVTVNQVATGLDDK